MSLDAASFEVAHEEISELRHAISLICRTGYCEPAICQRLGLDDITQLNWRSLAHYRDQRLGLRDPLDLAIDLFLLQGTLSDDELNCCLPQGSQYAFAKAGIIAQNRATVSLFPVVDKLIFADLAWPELRGITVPYNHVMAIGSDSRQLVHSTVRRKINSALDLCTGSGIHALLAAPHAKSVIAVDINPRAVQCVRFNAELMELPNVEVLEQDLYTSFHLDRFDLITANPPFVPSPIQTLGFRDGGRTGEDVLKRIVAGLPAHLETGGIAQIVTELGEREGEPLTDRIRRWLADHPLDVYMLRFASYTAAQYAIGHAQGDDYDEFLNSARQWEGNLISQGFTRVAAVVINICWSLNPVPWERIDTCPPPRRNAGEEILETFLAERISRIDPFEPLMQVSPLERLDPIAIVDAHILGDQHSRITATPLGRGLAIEQELNPLERKFLDEMQGDPETARTLLRKRLLRFAMQKVPQ